MRGANQGSYSALYLTMGQDMGLYDERTNCGKDGVSLSTKHIHSLSLGAAM